MLLREGKRTWWVDSLFQGYLSGKASRGANDALSWGGVDTTKGPEDRDTTARQHLVRAGKLPFCLLREGGGTGRFYRRSSNRGPGG